MTDRFRPTRRAVLTSTLAVSLLPGGLARAAGHLPAVIYAIGQKFDKSFNEGAYDGAMRFQQATGVTPLEFEPQSVADFERGVAALARRGANQIACIGFYYAQPLSDLAGQYKDVRFTLVDAVADRPNVESITYREQEGAFLAGIMAAMASRSGKLGFIGAIDIPLIRKFLAGFAAGARYARADAAVQVNFVGVTPAAFNDPTTGSELARAQADAGVDVIFAGAGVTNLGIFQTAADRKILAIGVDSNQNGLYPGTILTSQLKRVDVAVYESFTAARDGYWQAGLRSLGLKENGVDVVFDRFNAPLVSYDLQQKVEFARTEIVAGRITVPER